MASHQYDVSLPDPLHPSTDFFKASANESLGDRSSVNYVGVGIGVYADRESVIR